MLHACERFELYTFSSFREIKTNSLLPRFTDQQLSHFSHQWGVPKVVKRQFPTFVRISISAIHIRLFSKFKALLSERNLYYPHSSPVKFVSQPAQINK